MISDCDSKTFKLLSDQLPYGVSNLVNKHECVGHVQKSNGHGTKSVGKGEVCEWDGRACEDEVEGAAHRLDNKTVDSLLWQSHQIQHQ